MKGVLTFYEHFSLYGYRIMTSSSYKLCVISAISTFIPLTYNAHTEAQHGLQLRQYCRDGEDRVAQTAFICLSLQTSLHVSSHRPCSPTRFPPSCSFLATPLFIAASQHRSFLFSLHDPSVGAVSLIALLAIT